MTRKWPCRSCIRKPVDSTDRCFDILICWRFCTGVLSEKDASGCNYRFMTSTLHHEEKIRSEIRCALVLSASSRGWWDPRRIPWTMPMNPFPFLPIHCMLSNCIIVTSCGWRASSHFRVFKTTKIQPPRRFWGDREKIPIDLPIHFWQTTSSQYRYSGYWAKRGTCCLVRGAVFFVNLFPLRF